MKTSRIATWVGTVRCAVPVAAEATERIGKTRVLARLFRPVYGRGQRSALSLPVILLVLANAVGASAQTNSGTPAASDYAALSRFVTDRNIFDPGRQPHSASSNKRTPRVTRTHSTSAPAFTFVGTMSYEKGLFAFFSGNSDDLKKVLPASGAIAGHTVVEMAPGLVTLESDDKKERVRLRVGDVMRQENGKWEWSGAGVAPLAESVNMTETAGVVGADNPPAAPSSALGQNDVLKRLMEKRAKESQ